MTNTSRFLVAACAATCLFFGAGCEYLRQDMANQPKNRPLSPSPSFEDGRSERPLVENTVARGSLADDELFVPKDSNHFPLPLDLKLLERDSWAPLDLGNSHPWRCRVRYSRARSPSPGISARPVGTTILVQANASTTSRAALTRSSRGPRPSDRPRS